MSDVKLFPILERVSKQLDVPFSAIAPHAKQAYINHGQTLERLAERGGLSYAEFWFVMQDEDWDDRMIEYARDNGKELAERLAAAPADTSIGQE